ncbi:Rhodanese-like domain-containing protein [Syncephalis plumigaleata]|nr:Rhodanese-like domain-containing protein [Syncephalis plumigaleata]
MFHSFSSNLLTLRIRPCTVRQLYTKYRIHSSKASTVLGMTIRNMSCATNKQEHRPLCTTEWLWNRMNTPDTAKATGAHHFDIDVVADRSVDLPHMLPSTEQFAEAIGDLGIGNDDHVSNNVLIFIIYIFGHNHVSVLDGGLTAWRHAQLPLEQGPAKKPIPKKFNAQLNPELLVVYQQLREYIGKPIGDSTPQIVDARGAPRFSGAAPDPRAGIPSGHMPGAFNVHYSTLVNEESHTLKTSQEIRDIFEKQGVQLDKPIIASCGSGVAVYDGSWTEYASRPESIIAKSIPTRVDNPVS